LASERAMLGQIHDRLTFVNAERVDAEDEESDRIVWARIDTNSTMWMDRLVPPSLIVCSQENTCQREKAQVIGHAYSICPVPLIGGELAGNQSHWCLIKCRCDVQDTTPTGASRSSSRLVSPSWTYASSGPQARR
jgi:hypothetical protein